MKNPDTQRQDEHKETPDQYGIHGYELKQSVIKYGGPVEFRGTLVKKVTVRNDNESPHNDTSVTDIIRTKPVLISNQGTMEGEPKFIDGNNKRIIPDDAFVLVHLKDLAAFRADPSHINLYSFNGAKITRVEEHTQIEDIRKQIRQMFKPSIPPPSNGSYRGRRF